MIEPEPPWLNLVPVLIVLALVASAVLTLWSVMRAARDRVFPPAFPRRDRAEGAEFSFHHPVSIGTGNHRAPSGSDDGDSDD
jgi:hypothetical protein